MIKITDIFKVSKGSKHLLEPKFQYYVHDDHYMVFIKKEPTVDIVKIPIDIFKIFCSSLVGTTEIDYLYLDEHIDLRVINTNNEYDTRIYITHISTLPKEKYELLMYKLVILKCKELILSKFPSNIVDIKNKKLDKLFTLNHFYKLVPKLNRDAYDFDIIQDAIKAVNVFEPEFIQNPFARSIVIIQNSEYLTRYYTISDQYNKVLSRLNSRITQVNSEWNLATKRKLSFAQFSKDVQNKKDILIRETKDIIMNCHGASDEYDLLVNDFQVMPNWTLKIRYDVIKK